MKQEIFDKTCMHLLRQGATMLNSTVQFGPNPHNVTPRRANKDYDGGEICKRCALTFIFHTFPQIKTVDGGKMYSPLCYALFVCHDYVPQERWPGFMRGIARSFGLSELSIDMWEAEQSSQVLLPNKRIQDEFSQRS